MNPFEHQIGQNKSWKGTELNWKYQQTRFKKEECGTHRLEGAGEDDEEATTNKTDRRWIHDEDDDDDDDAAAVEFGGEEEFDADDGEDEVLLRRKDFIKGCFCWVSIWTF